MIPTLLRGAVLLVVVWAVLVGSVIGAAPLLNPPAPQLSYVSQFDSNDWHIILMDLRFRLAVDLSRDLFDPPARSRFPAWSPDGTQLAFVSDSGMSQAHIYLYDFNTRDLRQLTELGAYYTLPVWSPDGALLAFGSLSNVRRGIRVLDMASDTLREITPPALASSQSPRFSPDGTLLSFMFVLDDYSRHVYIVEPDGDNLRHVFGGTYELQEPVWSPDGRYLAISDRNRDTGQMTVHLVEVASGEIHPVFQTYQLNHDLTWSPDGKRLTLSIQIGDGTSSIVFVDNLQAALVDGVTAVNTTALSIRYTRETYNTKPLYLPDGEMLVFMRQNRELPSPELYLTDIAGERVTRLTVNTRQDWFPVWRHVR